MEIRDHRGIGICETGTTLLAPARDILSPQLVLFAPTAGNFLSKSSP